MWLREFYTTDWKDRDWFDKFLVGVICFQCGGFGYFLPRFLGV